MFTDWVLKQVNFQSLVWFLLCLNITYIAWGTTTRLWGSSPVCVCLTLVTCLSSVWNLRKGNNTRDEKLVLNNVHEYHCSHMTFKTTTTICVLSINHLALISLLLIIVFGRSTFVGSAWSFVFFHPHHNGQWPPTSKDFYTRSYPLHYFHILILGKEPVFPFSILGAKLGNYWYHSLWYDAVLD